MSLDLVGEGRRCRRWFGRFHCPYRYEAHRGRAFDVRAKLSTVPLSSPREARHGPLFNSRAKLTMGCRDCATRITIPVPITVQAFQVSCSSTDCLRGALDDADNHPGEKLEASAPGFTSTFSPDPV